MKTETTVVKLPKTLVDKLKARRRPHQSIAGAIEELLAIDIPAVQVAPIPIKPEPMSITSEDTELKEPIDELEEEIEPVVDAEGFVSFEKAVDIIFEKSGKKVNNQAILKWASQKYVTVENNMVDLQSLQYFLDSYSL